MFKDEFPATYGAVLLYRQKKSAAQASASGVAVVPDQDLPQASNAQPSAAAGEPFTTPDLVIRLTIEVPAARRLVDIAITIGPSAAAAEMSQPEIASGPRETAR